MLKNLGLVTGRVQMNVFTTRARELIEGKPALVAQKGGLVLYSCLPLKGAHWPKETDDLVV